MLKLSFWQICGTSTEVATIGNYVSTYVHAH